MKYGNFRLLFENSSFVDSENAYANLGDNIIALSLDHIYSELGIHGNAIAYVNKDGTRDYNGEYLILLAYINLWDSSIERRLPTSPYIYPLFISVVANRDIFMDYPELIEYFKKYAPVGCRDEQTMKIFRRYGIEAYLMGCVTICLPKRKSEPQNGKVFLVDISDELENHIPESLKAKSEKISHAVKYQEYPVTVAEDKRLTSLAKGLLDRYANEGELVVTSRLHVAAPCVAMGIPVVFASNNIDFRFGWLDKYIKLYSLDEYPEIDWNPKPIELETIKEKTIKYIGNSLKRIVKSRKDVIELSEYYEDRDKTEFLLTFRNEIKKNFPTDKNFKYVIWGAGQHCYYAHSLVSELIPSAILVAIVDKYKNGNALNVPIIKPKELERFDCQHVFITTRPGKLEAILKLQETHGADAHQFYTVLVSQQKS